MNNKERTYIFTVTLISLLLAVGIASFEKSIAQDNINTCREQEINGVKDESYFECLEQNDLNTWDMNHEELTLTIWFWFIFVFMFIAMFAVVNIPFYIWYMANM